MKLKLIDKLISKSFIGPYVIFFFIVEFVLIMQFLWKYIDDILGKGFTVWELLLMIFYYGVTIIPMAIPLTILISSVMVYGELSEKYELVSMKSAGISLVRILRAGFVISILTAMFSLFASNYLKPIANYNFQSTFLSLSRKKPTLSIEEGIFNHDFNGYTIRVGTKGADGIKIKDVLVYDHKNAHSGQINVITADHGEMYATEDGNYFIMKLFDGEHVVEIQNSKQGKKQEHNQPLMRTNFKEWNKLFDMTAYNQKGSINMDQKKHDMMNGVQMLEAIDSINIKLQVNAKNGIYDFAKVRKVNNKELDYNKTTKKVDEDAKRRFEQGVQKIKGKTQKKKSTDYFSLLQYKDHDAHSFYKSIDSTQIRTLTINAASRARSLKDKTNQYVRAQNNLFKKKDKFYLRFYQQFSWAFICIVFLFIGAPLGSIVKKGGFGFPVLIAIVFFVAFIILMITGEKLLKSHSVTPFIAAWLPSLVLTPIAILVTFLALKDLKMGDLFPEFRKLVPSNPKDNIKLLEESEDLLSNH